MSLAQPVSKSKVRALVVAGAVYLNGKRVRIASKTLINGARIEVHVDLTRMASSVKTEVVELLNSDILFRDKWVLVVNKPAGLPTQPTVDEARANLFQAVKSYLKKGAPGVEPYVGLHHRLDKDTSGVVAFAIDPRANAGFAQAFAQHTARKTYWAIVAKTRRGQLADHWEVKNFLGKVNQSGPARYGAVHAGGDTAHTRFRCLKQNDSVAWLEASPITGRTHQIRVHLAEDHLPILADPFYGAEGREQSERLRVPRLMLHAARLELAHPVSGEKWAIDAPMPTDMKKIVGLFG